MRLGNSHIRNKLVLNEQIVAAAEFAGWLEAQHIAAVRLSLFDENENDPSAYIRALAGYATLAGMQY